MVTLLHEVHFHGFNPYILIKKKNPPRYNKGTYLTSNPGEQVKNLVEQNRKASFFKIMYIYFNTQDYIQTLLNLTMGYVPKT